MSIIKQISVYDGSSWGINDIGANAGNIDLIAPGSTTTTNLAGSSNLFTALNNILPTNQLTASRVVITDANKKLATSNITSTQLASLSGVTNIPIQTQINTLNTNLTIDEEVLQFSYNNNMVNIYFRKYGKVVSVIMPKSDSSMILPTTWTNVGTLSRIKPPTDRYITVVTSNGKSATFRIYSDGGVRIIAHSSDAMWLQCSATVVF